MIEFLLVALLLSHPIYIGQYSTLEECTDRMHWLIDSKQYKHMGSLTYSCIPTLSQGM